MALATLVVDLILKAGGFESDMGRASKTAQKRMKEIEASAKRMGIALGVALAAGVTALGTAVKGAIDRADDLHNAAQKIGVTTEALSGLEYAAKQAGVGLEELQSGLAIMVRTQAAAAQGNDKATATYEAFSIAIKDASGHLRDSQSILLDWAEVFEKLPDGAEKTALAMRVFGKSGAELIPFLNEGRAGIAELTAEAERLGLVISTETGRQADEFNDQLDALKGAVTGAATALAIELLPDLIELARSLQESTAHGEGLSRGVDVLSTALEGVGWVLEKVDQFTRGLALGFHHATEQASNFITALDSLRNMDISGIRNAILEARGDLGRFYEERGEILNGLGSKPKANRPGGAIEWIDAPAAGGRNANDTVAAAAKLLATETAKGTGASKAATEARRAAAEAAREQAERERELAEAVKKVADASADFRKEAEDMAAERAGPQAEAALDYKRQLEDLRATAKQGEIGAADLAAAEKDLAAQFAETTAEIDKRLNPGKQVLDDLQFQIDLTKMLTNEERDRAIFMRESINATLEQADAYARMQTELEETREAIAAADEFRGHWEDAFASIFDGSKSAKDAFKDLANSILADIARVAARKLVEGLFGSPGTALGGGGGAGGILGFFSSLFGSANGNVFDHGAALTAYRLGGVVDRPTVFPMRNGAGLMGEAGPEAIIPLARDSQGRLGVRGGGGGITINVGVTGEVSKKTQHDIATVTARRLELAQRGRNR